jgi:hypothetical protein
MADSTKTEVRTVDHYDGYDIRRYDITGQMPGLPASYRQHLYTQWDGVAREGVGLTPMFNSYFEVRQWINAELGQD